ncbi:S-adenosylmethionine-dependent methyltransferase domain-containing protein [Ictalurus furcatus]|uniref:S-adenosylmethionine-dependent methyltransferase domain-containing protein n=1 Tax=Ictalurus furcatus TaxID=66913 RepID=UPI0023502ADE|nr:S-adenosylmethionine-dependent methyltransferase domain-containing protein [Ictalurus furcatus]
MRVVFWGDTEDLDSKVLAGESPKRRKSWEPGLGTERFCFFGHEISIQESFESYGALTWPGAVALCRYLEANHEHISLLDKAVLELGAGTGLVSIVACLMGAWVTATDLPDIMDNLNFNLSRNTRGRCKYTPQVAQLNWGEDLDHHFPSSIYNYDYILCADVVYHHNCLDELLLTMKHFCKPGTTLLWANKIRFAADLNFIESFKAAFNTILLVEVPEEMVRIYQATAQE